MRPADDDCKSDRAEELTQKADEHDGTMARLVHRGDRVTDAVNPDDHGDALP